LTTCPKVKRWLAFPHASFVKAPMSAPSENVVPLARPTLGVEEEQAVCEVLRSGWVSQGPRVIDFENALAELLGCKYVRAVNSGTSALMLALKAFDVGPGDSVVVPAFTCPASALPVLAVGAEPVFADIELSSFNTTWRLVEPAIRPNTRAVILVHFFGRMADAAGLAPRCRDRRIVLIEDAALALGARQAGRQAGTIGDAGCLSFHPRKMITTGEGGAVCTDDPRVVAHVETDRNYGAAVTAWARFQENVGRLQGFERLAFNAKLTDLQAAIGVPQVARLPGFIAERRRIAAAYRESLAGLPALELPVDPDDPEEHVYQAFVCLWKPEPVESLLADRAALQRAVSSVGVLRSEIAAGGVAVSDAGQFLPSLPVFRSRTAEHDPGEACPAAELAAKLTFALPIFPGMTEREVERVIQAVRDAVRGR
jgi:perosamine synthetase